MEKLGEIIDQLVLEKPQPHTVAEIAKRTQLLIALFVMKRQNPKDPRIEMYMQATSQIPIFWFEFALAAVLRSHHWPNVPEVADLWAAARYAAGMHRERYRAGNYLPPSREWPPDGRRHAIQFGEFELVDDTMAIGPGEISPALLVDDS